MPLNFYFLEKNQKKILIFIVLSALAISLEHSFYFRIPPIVDAGAYDAIAQNLLAGRGYRQELGVPFEKDNAIGRVGPGYEFFLAAVYFLFGHRYWVVWILQALFHSASIFLIFGISMELGRGLTGQGGRFSVLPAALFSAALFGFYPDLLIGTSMLLTESLSILLMLSVVYLFFKYYSNENLPVLLAGSVLFGFSILVRSALGLLVFPFFILFCQRKKWAHFFIFFMIFAAILAPWTIRNYRIYKAFIPTDLTFGDNFLSGNNPYASGELDDSRVILNKSYEAYDIVTAGRMMTKDALKFIVSDPLNFMRITGGRISMYFSFIRPTGWWPYLFGSRWQPVIVSLSAFFSALIFTLGFYGIYAAFKNKFLIEQKKLFFLLICLAGVVLPIIFIIVETRYRYPSYPFMTIFSGLGLQFLLFGEEKLGDRLKPLLAILGLLLLNAGWDASRNLSRIMERLFSLK